MEESLLVPCPACGTSNRVLQSRQNDNPRCGRCGVFLWEGADHASGTGDGTPVPGNEANFQAEVLQAGLPVLVDFWAPWCGPCQELGPALATLAREHAGRLKVVKINVDENPRLAQQYQVRSIPLMIMFEHGQVKKQFVGALPLGQLRNWINLTLGWI